MSGIVPPILPPLGTNAGNTGSANRVDIMPTINDTINTTTTTNVAQIFVDENLPQLLDSKGGFHVTNVPEFDKEDFTSQKVRMGCDEEINEILRIKLRKAGSNEEIFTFVAWIRAFTINEPIYSELCHEIYLTHEFDKVCVDDELQTKKIIKFKLGVHAHSLTLLEFARRLRLYHADELDEEGFDVYFQGSFRSEEHFNAQEYWLSISREDNLSLSRSHAFTIWNPVLRVVHKMITYGLCQRTTGDFDTTTLRELINSEGRLILKDPQAGVHRVAIPRPPRASMQDLYDRMCSMKIC
nr:hypothetical protein [Tanacetum cinerariifolium]